MYSVSAINRTTALLSAMLMMAALWGIGRIPGANLLMIVFTFLSSAFLMDIPSFRERILLSARMACYASAVQFLISMTSALPFLQIITIMVLVYIVFRTLPDHHAGCIVMITGYLAFFAPSGFIPAISRSIDIFAGIFIIMIATTLCQSNLPPHRQNLQMNPFSPYQALMLSAELTIGAILSQMLQLTQGPWIMLTILFIVMSKTQDTPEQKLIFQRIFAIPLGIIIAGFLLDTFFKMDYHLFYLLPFIGAAGFFILYAYGNFFLFSVVFMVALILFSDWMAGPFHRFNFWESFFSRSIATLIGALLELFLNLRQNLETSDTI